MAKTKRSLHAYFAGPIRLADGGRLVIAEGLLDGAFVAARAETPRAALAQLAFAADGARLLCAPVSGRAAASLGFEEAPLPPALARRRAALALRFAAPGAFGDDVGREDLLEFLESALALQKSALFRRRGAQTSIELSLPTSASKRGAFVAFVDPKSGTLQLYRASAVKRIERLPEPEQDAAIDASESVALVFERQPRGVLALAREAYGLPALPLPSRRVGGEFLPARRRDLTLLCEAARAVSPARS